MQLSTSANFTFNRSVLERPDLGPPARTINMIRLGEALTEPDAGVGGPPVKALVVYNSNPAAVAPDRNTVLRGLAREDLFTVVLEHFQTDTCDWADIVLPATTQLEHWDVHLAYGHHYASLNRPSIAPLGEALPNTEIFRRLAARIGMTGSWTWDDDLTLIRQALDTQTPKLAGRDVRDAARARLGAAQRADAVPPVRRGRVPHAEWEVRVLLAASARTWGSIRCRRTSRRTSRSSGIRRSSRAIR